MEVRRRLLSDEEHQMSSRSIGMNRKFKRGNEPRKWNRFFRCLNHQTALESHDKYNRYTEESHFTCR